MASLHSLLYFTSRPGIIYTSDQHLCYKFSFEDIATKTNEGFTLKSVFNILQFSILALLIFSTMQFLHKSERKVPPCEVANTPFHIQGGLNIRVLTPSVRGPTLDVKIWRP